MRKAKLPEFLRKYFWEVDLDNMTLEEAPTFILKRVLDRGNTTALRWLLKNYSGKQIQNVILNSRDLSQITANFWTEILKLNRNKVKCLQKPYSRIRFGLYS